MKVQEVEGNLVNLVCSLDTHGFTFKKSHNNVKNVGRNFIQMVSLQYTNVFTLERSCKSTQNVDSDIIEISILLRISVFPPKQSNINDQNINKNTPIPSSSNSILTIVFAFQKSPKYRCVRCCDTAII